MARPLWVCSALLIILSTSACQAREPQAVPPPPVESALSTTPATDIDARAAQLKEMAPEGFHVVVEPPFVVLGDEAPARVRSRTEHTVHWATTMLKKDFFKKDPEVILAIWLFKDAASYETHTAELFGEYPDTPYGYYSTEHNALIMNIATGGGTLVHEIVHPYMEANFPACPAWFNEGMGSLFEQCGERDGHIVGATNWRLAGLQEALEEGSVPTLETLTHTTTDQFYGDGSWLYYAMARYLCYYLQEKGLLRTYYREFVEHASEDPTGYQTLQRVLGAEDMAAFQTTWEAYVMALRFPPEVVIETP